MAQFGNLPRNALKQELVTENLSSLLGEILTIIDASTEGDKNKAIKDLMRQTFSKKMDWIFSLSFKEQMGENEVKGIKDQWEDGLIPYKDGDTYSFKG